MNTKVQAPPWVWDATFPRAVSLQRVEFKKLTHPGSSIIMVTGGASVLTTHDPMWIWRFQQRTGPQGAVSIFSQHEAIAGMKADITEKRIADIMAGMPMKGTGSYLSKVFTRESRSPDAHQPEEEGVGVLDNPLCYEVGPQNEDSDYGATGLITKIYLVGTMRWRPISTYQIHGMAPGNRVAVVATDGSVYVMYIERNPADAVALLEYPDVHPRPDAIGFLRNGDDLGWDMKPVRYRRVVSAIPESSVPHLAVGKPFWHEDPQGELRESVPPITEMYMSLHLAHVHV